MLVRYVGLDVPAVRGQCDEPVLAVVFQKIHVGEHRRGILRTEPDRIHDGRIQTVAADLPGVKGIAHTDKALPKPVCEPFRVKGGDVCPLPGIDNHRAPPPFSFTALLRSSHWPFLRPERQWLL